MFRPYIKRTSVLIAIALLNILLVYIAHTSSKFIPDKNYDLKIEASNIMEDALLHINTQFDNINDSSIAQLDVFNSGIIGVDSIYSSMTTKYGILESKLAVTNPDFSAIYIDYFAQIDDSLGSSLTDIAKQDTIAVSLTGSFPGANIALLSACKASNIYPVIISSIGSSSWGANRLNMTWVDIENKLENKIFDYRSSAVSMGGDSDIAEELSEKIKTTLREKIAMYKYYFINQKNLQESISERVKIYNSITKIKNYKAYINIGGSASSLGNEILSQFFSPGLNYKKNEDVYIDEEIIETNTSYDLNLTPVTYIFESNNIPIINVKNINRLCMQNDLPYWDLNTYTRYSSHLFGKTIKYPLLTVWLCFILSVASLLWVVFSSIKQVNKKMEEIENDTVI